MEFACFQRDEIISVGWEAGGGGCVDRGSSFSGELTFFGGLDLDM